VQKNNKKRGTLLKEFLSIKSGDDLLSHKARANERRRQIQDQPQKLRGKNIAGAPIIFFTNLPSYFSDKH
jgi:hypothetical protein